MKRKKKKKLLLKLVILFALVAACFAAYYFINKDSDSSVTTVKSKKKKIDEKKLKIVDVNSTSRPYAVMINNQATARPLQSGLQDAYIMYEMIVEGGITRYLALFLDQTTERIGSIRSARHYYLDYALENDAIYVHHGQSPEAQADFSALSVDRIVADDNKTGWRDKSLNVSSEHTLFTSISKLNSGLGKKRTTRNKDLLLNYSVDSVKLDQVENNKVANKVVIKYSNNTTSSYEYDSVNKVYNRFVNGNPHKDYVTKQQYTFKNIITYQVKNTTLNDGENKGRQTIDNIGSGTGYYISEGYAVPITWEKKSRSAQTIYRFEDGKELTVNDGNTFIQIQPFNQTLTIE